MAPRSGAPAAVTCPGGDAVDIRAGQPYSEVVEHAVGSRLLSMPIGRRRRVAKVPGPAAL